MLIKIYIGHKRGLHFNLKRGKGKIEEGFVAETEAIDVGYVSDAFFTHTPYPELLGRLPKQYLQTECEKKKQECEEQMLAPDALAKDADSNEDENFDICALEKDADYEDMINRGDEIDQE